MGEEAAMPCPPSPPARSLSIFRDTCVPPRRRLFAAGALVAALALTGHAADPSNPLPPHLEALAVGPATEFRMAIVHPLYAPPVPAPPAAEGVEAVPALASATAPDALGVADAPNSARTRLTVTDLDAKAAFLVLPGDLVRSGIGDFAVREHRLLRPAAKTELPVVRVSHAPAQDAPREEPRFLHPLPGPALLWELLNGATEKQLVATSDELAAAARVTTSRRSPAELAQGERIVARIREYRAALRTLAPPRGGIRRETVGYAFVVDGALAAIETFADGAAFTAAWEARVEGLAVESCLLEAEAGLLDQEVPDPQNPDRCLKDVKGALLAVYAVEPRRDRLEGLGHVLSWAKDATIGRALLTTDGRMAHLFLTVDPAHRKTPEPEDPLSPGALERKARMTEAEKRWLERRKQSQ